MKIPLIEFEQIVDETILKRGLSYFKKGVISDFSEIASGEYEAIVSGSEDYCVQLKIKENIITEHQCDCPYDLGPICKHIVAVIFYFLQDEFELNKNPSKSTKNVKTKSVNQQIKEILNAISHNELAEFIEVNCKKDKKFRNHFLASFGHLNQHQSKEFYQKQIRSILNAAAGRDGWIGWSDMKYVYNTTKTFLENAEQSFEKKNLENVFFISTALLEEMTKALQFGDDSNGEIGYFIESAMELLSKLTHENLSNTFKKDFLNYCITAFNKKLFNGWDWHLGILQIASKLIDNESDADILLDCLEFLNGDYERKYAQSFKLELLRRFKSQEEVEKFINKHISNSEIRSKEIEIGFKNKNFERVINLSKDGILCDEKDKPGLVKLWYNWLLKVAQHQNDTMKIIEYARFLLIDNYHPEQDYYQILKSTIEPERWNSFLEDIILEITPNSRWKYKDLIREIYIKEAWWDRLFLMLKENLSLENIQANEVYLATDYATELIEFYSERITNYVEKYVGRNHYQTACKYLRRMKKLGGNQQVNEMIASLRKQYPQRKALMDELNRV